MSARKYKELEIKYSSMSDLYQSQLQRANSTILQQKASFSANEQELLGRISELETQIEKA